MDLNDQMLEKTLGEWIQGAQKQMAPLRNTIDTAMDAVEHLEPRIQTQWRGSLNLLKVFTQRQIRDRATGIVSTGDPVAILGYMVNIRPKLQQLREIADTSRDPLFVRAALNIDETFTAYEQAIGRPHPALTIGNVSYQTHAPGVRSREGQMLQAGLAIAGSAAVIGGALLAFFAKDDEANWTLPLAYGAATAAIMGYGRLTETSGDQLQRELAFLRGTTWQRLRDRYGIRGQSWETFVRNYYQQRTSNEDIRNFLTPRRDRPVAPDVLKRQRAAILALAPAGIQPRIEDMLNTGSGPTASEDFRRFAGELNHATTPFAQRAVAGNILGPQAPATGDAPQRRLPPGTVAT